VLIPLNPPRIGLDFEYIYKPLIGVLGGATVCMFLESNNVPELEDTEVVWAA
jgi:hypothetical protein